MPINPYPWPTQPEDIRPKPLRGTCACCAVSSPTGDTQRRAGDIARLLRGNVHNGIGDLARLPIRPIGTSLCGL